MRTRRARPLQSGCRSGEEHGAACGRKFRKCTVKPEGGKVCEQSRRLLDAKYNLTHNALSSAAAKRSAATNG